MKSGDIVKLLKDGNEYLVLEKAKDLETNKEKYIIVGGINQDIIYIVEEKDMVYLSDLENECMNFMEEANAIRA